MTAQAMTTDGTTKTRFNWRLFGTLLGMVAFGLLALIPYGLTLEGHTLSTEMIPQSGGQGGGRVLVPSLPLPARTPNQRVNRLGLNYFSTEVV